MQDLIAAVYASKEKYDRNCTAQRLPSQTLARHLDDFLVHRYASLSTFLPRFVAVSRPHKQD